jgi:nucleoside-diphosphate-sugar epimerase
MATAEAPAGLTLVIGAAGSIGQKLCAGLVAARGHGSVVAAVRNTPLPPELSKRVHTVTGVDIRDEATIQRVFDLHPRIDTVRRWRWYSFASQCWRGKRHAQCVCV